MNRLIQDLSAKAWNYAYDHDTVNGEVVICDGINMNFSDLFIEKYTELIVKECMNLVKDCYAEHQSGQSSYQTVCASTIIEDYFGVE